MKYATAGFPERTREEFLSDLRERVNSAIRLELEALDYPPKWSDEEQVDELIDDISEELDDVVQDVIGDLSEEWEQQ